MINITESNFDLLELNSLFTNNRNTELEKFIIVNRKITEEIFNSIVESNNFINVFTGEAINDFKTLEMLMC